MFYHPELDIESYNEFSVLVFVKGTLHLSSGFMLAVFYKWNPQA